MLSMFIYHAHFLFLSDDQPPQIDMDTGETVDEAPTPDSGLERFLNRIDVLMVQNEGVAAYSDVYGMYEHALKGFPHEQKLRYLR